MLYPVSPCPKAILDSRNQPWVRREICDERSRPEPTRTDAGKRDRKWRQNLKKKYFSLQLNFDYTVGICVPDYLDYFQNMRTLIINME